MNKILSLSFIITDLMKAPIIFIQFIIMTIDLLWGCANTKGNFKKEFADYTEISINKLKERLNMYGELISR